MKHLIFQSQTQADAFIQDLQSQGVIQTQMGRAQIRHTDSTNSTLPTTNTTPSSAEVQDAAEDAGVGAVRGTGAGVVAGAVAGVVATALTGGLFAPVILGMAALGSGVGAAVGAAGGAAGVDETSTDSSLKSDYSSDVNRDQYDRLNTSTSSGGYTLAVDDSVPYDAVMAAAKRHGGEFV
ncbi:MAG: hypothetical protein H7095_05540 [Pseudopedobacter sp.]|nr:hypothetical protein [Deinococcales bacterium]